MPIDLHKHAVLEASAGTGKTHSIEDLTLRLLTEVGVSLDQVLIVNHGKLVVESSLEQLTARVGGSVRVRSPEVARLQEALSRAQIETSPSNEHALLIHGATSDRVGDIAFAAGIPIHELASDASSLEDVFLELTSEPAP